MRRSDKPKKEPRINPWKWAFTALLICVLSFVIFITLKITVPSVSQSNEISYESQTNRRYSTVPITMSERSFSAAINYLLRESEKGSGIHYRFILKKSAILMGTTHILGKKVTFSLYAKPLLDSDGNIVLKIKSVGIGSLNAPPAFILNYVKKNYDLKGIVAIYPSHERVILRLNRLSGKGGLRLKATKIDLNHNQVDFSILIPQ